jgi:hypothetical protein
MLRFPSSACAGPESILTESAHSRLDRRHPRSPVPAAGRKSIKRVERVATVFDFGCQPGVKQVRCRPYCLADGTQSRIDMKRHIWKACVVVVGLFAVSAAQPAVARAGLLADTWYAIFGPPGTPYFPGAYASSYGPSYSAGYGAGSYSVGFRNVCCRPVPVYPPYNPCAVPCPTVCDPCAVGPAVGPATSGSPPPQTFKKPGPMNDEPPQPDSKFKSRDDSKKFRPTDKSKQNGDGKKAAFPTPANDGDDNGSERKAFRVPSKDPEKEAPGPVIRQKKPVPAKTPMQNSDGEKKKELPALIRPNFDDKITWKPALPRTRLVINARVSHPELSRTVVDPNAGWRPLREEGRVVRK